ncbi:hypothetical protein [Shewanella surugensis]|uniref:Lipoprotein n=1 Tax=Shewanella surugensis TaxID=212020 RepID=A0ABT0LE89_9GAMM|nr:hypothetical protein [Shewanella surugensis]MCL1126008.1 hypothetical protein [Shewanella surugensis]
MLLLENRINMVFLIGLMLMGILIQGCAPYLEKSVKGPGGVYSACNHHLNVQLPIKWIAFDPILCARLAQSKQKMKLTKNQVNHFVGFLWSVKTPTPALLALTNMLPKTTLELLRSVESRGVSLSDAEKMAKYLADVPSTYSIHNIAYFDENTAHIIGRQWHEIDYGGEGMTWQQQQKEYAPYDITDFKSVANLEKFFPVESKLPYFKEAYQ